VGGLIQAADGYVYGACYHGGVPWDIGTIFRLDPSHGCDESDHTWNVCSNLSLVFAFGINAAGAHPYAGLTLGRDGNLYGTTAFGGYGAGNIFRIIMPGPKLNSTSVGRDLVLSWRTNYTGYVLQSSRDLQRGEWTDCTNTVSIVGGQYFITNSLPGSARFFRLSKISGPTGGKDNRRTGRSSTR
jgi:hypothetical protein